MKYSLQPLSLHPPIRSLEMRILRKMITTDLVVGNDPVPTRQWQVLLTVTELTKQIQEGIEDRRVFRFKMLPFIALEDGHPWASNPPAGTRVTPFTETSYALAWAINRELLEASHLARTWAPNGNRWVHGQREYTLVSDLRGCGWHGAQYASAHREREDCSSVRHNA